MLRFFRTRAVALATVAVCGLGVHVSLAGQALGGSDILVSNFDSGTVTEYSSTGAVVQSFTLPNPETVVGNSTRDLIVSADRKAVYIYNGTATPQMQTLVVSTSGITGQTFPFWGTPNNITYGGIALYGTGVFATDGNSYQDTNPQTQEGIVRFDTAGGATVRFGGGNEYQDDTMGKNGLLYGLTTNGLVNVYSPVTNAFIRTISLDGPSAGSDVRGIAVDSAGTIYTAGFDGTVKSVDSNGNTIKSVNAGIGRLSDIDLNNSGQLLIAGDSSQVAFLDTTLTTDRVVATGQFSELHVAWATGLTPAVPEPASGVSLAVGLLAMRRRR